MKWETKCLGDVADLSLGKMLDEKKNRGELLPYLANINVRWGELDLENLRQMRFEPSETDRYGLKYGDIVMCEGGEPGRCAIWKEPVPAMMIQKAIHRIRAHDCIDHRFLFYSFLHRGRLGGFAPLFTGATIKHLTLQNLAKLEIEFPELPLQARIADILSAYDDLIENNLKRIALLEESARLLYREWFVRLRFPGHEHTRIVDGVPEGWERGQVSDIGKIITGKTPSTEDKGNFGQDVQ
jgi:type I restriction enzyme, S subunit